MKSLSMFKFKNFKHIICGCGNDENKLKSLSEKFGLKKKIKSTGYLKKVDF